MRFSVRETPAGISRTLKTVTFEVFWRYNRQNTF